MRLRCCRRNFCSTSKMQRVISREKGKSSIQNGTHRRTSLITPRFGPRTLDIDILFIDNAIIDTPALTIPHPFVHTRDFVLGPLMEYALLSFWRLWLNAFFPVNNSIAPDFVHPTLFLSVRQLFANLRHPEVVIPPGPTDHHHTKSLQRVIPLRNKTLWNPDERTRIFSKYCDLEYWFYAHQV